MPQKKKPTDDILPVDTLLEQPTTSSDVIVEKASRLLQQEKFRARTKELIEEYTETVPFMRKVQEYADEQIDKRLFKNSKVVIGVVLTWIVTGVISYLVAKFSK